MSAPSMAHLRPRSASGYTAASRRKAGTMPPLYLGSAVLLVEKLRPIISRPAERSTMVRQAGRAGSAAVAVTAMVSLDGGSAEATGSGCGGGGGGANAAG